MFKGIKNRIPVSYQVYEKWPGRLKKAQVKLLLLKKKNL